MDNVKQSPTNKTQRKVKLQAEPSFILSNLDLNILNNMGDIKIHPEEMDKVHFV